MMRPNTTALTCARSVGRAVRVNKVSDAFLQGTTLREVAVHVLYDNPDEHVLLEWTNVCSASRQPLITFVSCGILIIIADHAHEMLIHCSRLERDARVD